MTIENLWKCTQQTVNSETCRRVAVKNKIAYF